MVTRIVDQLERRGYAERVLSQGDRRVVYAVLTQEAAELLTQADPSAVPPLRTSSDATSRHLRRRKRARCWTGCLMRWVATWRSPPRMATQVPSLLRRDSEEVTTRGTFPRRGGRGLEPAASGINGRPLASLTTGRNDDRTDVAGRSCRIRNDRVIRDCPRPPRPRRDDTRIGQILMDTLPVPSYIPILW